MMSDRDNTITFERSHLYAALLPLAFVVGLSLGYIFWGRGPSGTQTTGAVDVDPQQVAVQTTPRQITRYEIPIEGDPTLGPEDAPITLIEYIDYECPYCRKWYYEVFPRLQAEYPNQIRFVSKDFPLTNIHSNAQKASEAALCADDQDAYWDYREKLYGMEYGLSEEAYTQYASDLGLNMTAFEECMSSQKYKEAVEADLNYAIQLGVRSTPTFFLNGIPIVGAQPYEIFKQVIDQELSSETP
ncbi:MAG: thioredoxin domain-containing protein [Chloroflexota bacterium]